MRISTKVLFEGGRNKEEATLMVEEKGIWRTDMKQRRQGGIGKAFTCPAGERRQRELGSLTRLRTFKDSDPIKKGHY